MVKTLLLLAAAGALGTLARYGVYVASQRLPLADLPLATLTVNVLGSFVFGLIWPLVDQERLSPETRVVLLAGFLGAFTTFSTLAFETGELLRDGRWAAAGANLVANNLLGVAAVLGGLWVGSRM